jgi:hypothetical protein
MIVVGSCDCIVDGTGWSRAAETPEPGGYECSCPALRADLFSSFYGNWNSTPVNNSQTMINHAMQDLKVRGEGEEAKPRYEGEWRE